MDSTIKPLGVCSSSLVATVIKLVSWHNRNTNNPELSEVAAWLKDQLEALPGMQVELLPYRIEASPRVPVAKDVVQVVATLPGRTQRRVMVGAHFDSLNNEFGIDIKANAPGANDDASGIAVTLEMARTMASQKWKQTLCFCFFSGEEQGLKGSAALAAQAKNEKWHIDALLSNDMVGNTTNLLGVTNDHEVRLFSDSSFSHQSRELARFIEWLQRDSKSEFKVRLVLRADRFGRGGDHTPFNREGFTAVRFVEAVEEYSRQHTRNDLPEFVDEKYLANVARVNLLALETLANSAAQPTDVTVSKNQSLVTELSWKGDDSGCFRVYWRDTRSAIWENSRVVSGLQATIEEAHKDDYVFAVGAIGGIPVEAT